MLFENILSILTFTWTPFSFFFYVRQGRTASQILMKNMESEICLYETYTLSFGVLCICTIRLGLEEVQDPYTVAFLTYFKHKLLVRIFL